MEIASDVTQQPKMEQPATVLVVDDIESNRVLLKAILRRQGNTVLLAENGEQALDIYERFRPDIILMDLMMPLMDGYEATRQIKEKSAEEFIPIIFVTAVTDESSLAKCIEVGGDDFIVKPISATILKSKISSLLRQREVYREINTQRSILQQHHDRLLYEQEIAEHVFSKIIGNRSIDAINIKYVLSPKAIANGDIVLAATNPEGNQLVLLGDFTGHGLSAAIGAIPVSEVFYAMTAKGLGVYEILGEINRKLCQYLPTGQFLAACLLEWDYQAELIRIWNAGVPDVLHVSRNGMTVTRIPSDNLPIGVIKDDVFETNVETLSVEIGDRVYLCSDGLTESRNKQGEMYGQDRLEEIIVESDKSENLFDRILADVKNYCEGAPQDDDITLVEILCDAASKSKSGARVKRIVRKADWQFSLNIGCRELLDFDPISITSILFSAMPSLESHQAMIYMVIVELYTNALEHGVLGMDGSLKSTPEGFNDHYEERRRRLSALNKGWINLNVECFLEGGSGELHVKIEDSGSGFDSNTVVDIDGHDVARGRGIKLVKSICSNLEYSKNGACVKAVYSWDKEKAVNNAEFIEVDQPIHTRGNQA